MRGQAGTCKGLNESDPLSMSVLACGVTRSTDQPNERFRFRVACLTLSFEGLALDPGLGLSSELGVSV